MIWVRRNDSPKTPPRPLHRLFCTIHLLHSLREDCPCEVEEVLGLGDWNGYGGVISITLHWSVWLVVLLSLGFIIAIVADDMGEKR